jgi:type II secretory pathway pseudopilin PulG
MTTRQQLSGFSLVEVALAILIIGIVLGTLAVPLRAQLEARMMDETQRLLDETREALLGYAAIYGHFPCPADASSNGLEPAGTDHDLGVCPVWYGYLPAAELGITTVDEQGYAVDAWNRPENRIRYAVSSETVAGVTYAFSSESGMRSVGIDALDSANLLYVCGSGTGINPGVDCGTAPVLTSKAAVVVWSVGANAATGGTSIDEAENPNPNGGSADRIFVSRPRSAVAATAFDDLVTWIPLPLLVNRMVAAGQLP